jgi:hypothetical protein
MFGMFGEPVDDVPVTGAVIDIFKTLSRKRRQKSLLV